MTSKLLNEAESAVLQQTAELWNAYLALPMVHPAEKSELCAKIHDLQRMILARPAMREVRGKDPWP